MGRHETSEEGHGLGLGEKPSPSNSFATILQQCCEGRGVEFSFEPSNAWLAVMGKRNDR